MKRKAEEVTKRAKKRSGSKLHEVPDGWFAKTARPRLKGKAFIVRYTDDADQIMKGKSLRGCKEYSGYRLCFFHG
jgi:hypothetical protein